MSFTKIKPNEDQEVWVTSDPHINHKNLIRGISNWGDKDNCRPFENREEHNWAIINGINSNVDEDDILYILGDFYFGGRSSIWWFRKQLNVKDIRFIYGNHDNAIEKNVDLNIPKKDISNKLIREYYHFDIITAKGKEYLGYVYKDHCVIPAQNLFTSCKYYDQIEVWGQKYVLFHYSQRVWDKRHHGSYMLYGHSHNNLQERGDRSMDVGFESAYEILGQWRPFNIKEVQKRLQSRTNKPLDHHDKNTRE